MLNVLQPHPHHTTTYCTPQLHNSTSHCHIPPHGGNTFHISLHIPLWTASHIMLYFTSCTIPYEPHPAPFNTTPRSMSKLYITCCVLHHVPYYTPHHTTTYCTSLLHTTTCNAAVMYNYVAVMCNVVHRGKDWCMMCNVMCNGVVWNVECVGMMWDVHFSPPHHTTTYCTPLLHTLHVMWPWCIIMWLWCAICGALWQRLVHDV